METQVSYISTGIKAVGAAGGTSIAVASDKLAIVIPSVQAWQEQLAWLLGILVAALCGISALLEMLHRYRRNKRDKLKDRKANATKTILSD